MSAASREERGQLGLPTRLLQPLVGGRGAGGELLPPINPEQSPSTARERSDLSPDSLTWLLSPKHLAVVAETRRLVETHKGLLGLELLQGTC